MDNPIVLLHIFIASVLLGFIKFKTLSTSGYNWQQKFVEIWNDSVNFIITGLIGYFFVSIRLPILRNGANIGTGDVFLLIIFLFGIFGHLCVVSYLLTEGIRDVVKKYVRGDSKD